MTSTPSSVTAHLDMEDNPLDLHNSMGVRTRTPMAFTQEAADWISEADRTLFVQGTHTTDTKAREDAYVALAMTDQISSLFGLDSAQPTVMLADVRAQPPNQDHGYDIAGPEPFWTAPHSVGLSNSQASINGGEYMQKKMLLPFAQP